MQDGMMRAIVDAISESSSLMVAHLDGNPGISPSIFEYITLKLDATPPLKTENFIGGPKTKGNNELDPQTM